MTSAGAIINEDGRREQCHSHRELLRCPSEPRPGRLTLGITRLLEPRSYWYRVEDQQTYVTLRYVSAHSASDALAEDWRAVGDDLWGALRAVGRSVDDEARDLILSQLVHYFIARGDLQSTEWVFADVADTQLALPFPESGADD